MSTFTPNKNLEQPAYNSYTNSWNTPVNSDYSYIDAAIAGIQNINLTGVTSTSTPVSTPITLTNVYPAATNTFSYIPMGLNLTGTLTSNIVIIIPAGVTGNWFVTNGCTGTYTITIQSGGGGTSYTISQGVRIALYSDGTNISPSLLNASTSSTSSIELVVSGGGSPIATGFQGYIEVPFNCGVLTWSVVNGSVGSITFDVTSDNYASFGSNTSIVGTGTKPNTAAAIKGQAAPSGWTTTSIPAGNFIGFNVTANDTVALSTILLVVSRS